MTCTAASHRGGFVMVWLHFWGAVVAPIFIYSQWSLPAPEANIWLLSCKMLCYFHKLVAHFGCPSFGARWCRAGSLLMLEIRLGRPDQ